jgi:hypothetical protein
MPSRSVSDRPSRSTDHVELFRVHRFHHGVKPRALIPALCATDARVLVNFDDLPPRAISYRFQFSALIFGVLLRRADTNVECNALHDDLPAEDHLCRRYIPKSNDFSIVYARSGNPLDKPSPLSGIEWVFRIAERAISDSSVSLIYARRKIPFTLISTPMRRFSHRHIGRGIVFRTHNLDPASAVGVDHGRNFGARVRIQTRRQYHVGV